MSSAGAPVFLFLTGTAATAGGWATHRYRRAGTRAMSRIWVPAVVLTLATAPLAAATPFPAPTVVAAGGLAAATVIDAVDGRIPTPIAHGSTLAGTLAVGIHILITGEAEAAAGAYLAAAGLLALFGVAWLVGGVGFGDVRLVPALAPGLTGGTAGMAALIYMTLIVTAALVLVRRRRRWDRRVPLAPALFAGWLASLAVAAL